VVGSISTNAHGNGILHLNSALDNASELLSALPGISAGATVSVGVAGQAPILTGTLQAGVNLGTGGVGTSQIISGLTQAVSTLQNSVIPQLNSIVDNLTAHGGNVSGALGNVINRVDGIVNRLAGIVGSLTPSAVDTALGNMDLSGILGDLYGLVPNDGSGRV